MRERRGASRSAGGVLRIGGHQGQRDALVWLVGHYGPPLLPGDIGDPTVARAQECFWEWLGRDAMARASASERARTNETAHRLVQRLARSVDAVRRVDEVPTLMRARADGAVGRVLDHARQAGAAPLVELGVAAGAGRALWDEPCDTWVVLPSTAGLPSRRYVALRIVGDSMTPLLHSGDVVLVDLDGEIRSGTILVARGLDDGGVNDGYMVKHVDAIAGTTLQLSSLNPAYPGLAIPSDRRHILGPVVLRWCGHGGAAHER
jgi:phage repressor protein C with HTH and peptisase S24 domain